MIRYPETNSGRKIYPEKDLEIQPLFRRLPLAVPTKEVIRRVFLQPLYSGTLVSYPPLHDDAVIYPPTSSFNPLPEHHWPVLF